MLNKFIKTIHINYSKLFRFIFFLRYLLTIFFISFILFLVIPNFFDYEKRSKIIKNHLLKDYNFEINRYESIKFKPFPLPNLELKEVLIDIESLESKINVKNLKIYPKIFGVYNYDRFGINRIVLVDSDINLEPNELKPFVKHIFDKKKKLDFNDLNLEIKNQNKPIVKFEEIKFKNFGYKKNLINGKIFDKKFEIKIANKFQNIYLKLFKSGFRAEINFNENKKINLIEGALQSKILNTNIKFNFDYDGKIFNIYNYFLRSKNLSFKNESTIVLTPFLDIHSKFYVLDFDLKKFRNLNLKKIFEFQEFFKKINIKNEIYFESKKFNRTPIDTLNLEIDLAYGRMTYKKKFSILDSFFNCKGNINLLEENPILFFDCFGDLDRKQRIFKKFSIKSNIKNEKLRINTVGSLSIHNNKINFKKISTNNNYNASKEDLKYFKEKFEQIFFNENFLKIFNSKKIKKFISEIS